MSRVAAVTAVLALAAGPAFAWGERCEFREQREVTLETGGLERVGVIAGAGELEVHGDAGADRVRATGTACASSEALLAEIRLVVETIDGVPTVRAVLPQPSDSWFGENYAWLDLEVTLPAALAVRVQDSSGDATIRGVAAVDASDSSGDLEIEDVRGTVQVRDSSGDVRVRATGPVTVINDSSGDLELADIEGDAVVENDSSGDIDFDDVRGEARVDRDSSGSIRFARVRGSAIVGRDSSGSIEAATIGGDFIVRRDGSGGIRHRDVAGRVDLPSQD